MSAIESEPAAVTADATGAESTESRAPENGEREGNSSPTRKRRPAPYTRSFRGFLEQLGEDPREFDQRRRKLWDAFQPEDGFEEGLVEDMVENRWKLDRLTHEPSQAGGNPPADGSEAAAAPGLGKPGRGRHGGEMAHDPGRFHLSARFQVQV